MHQNLQQQYQECNCEKCRRLNLSNDSTPKKDFKKILKTAEKAFKKLHERGKYNPIDLEKVKEYKDLMEETSQIFTSTIPHEIPKEMKGYLEKDAFVFSGLKTHAQLAEARSLLKDESGNIRPYHDFEQKILKLNTNYNQHYLQAEYEFAIQSSQSAANWANLQEDTDRYWLEYRTAGDDRVRVSHQKLNKICLPKTDVFWTEFYPPNGWRCRCVAVEVLADDYTLSDSEKAIQEGEKATSQIGKNGKNKLEIFRFNPGIEKRVFPKGNSYEKVVGSDKVKDVINKESYKLLEDNERFNIERSRAINRGIDKIYSSLNEYESTCVHMYSMPDAYYGHLNNFNRHGKIRLGARADGFNKETLELMTNTINSALDKIPDRFIGTVYRGTDLTYEQFKVYEEAWKNKTEYIEKGFMSTTIDKTKIFEGDTMFIVETKNGAKIDKLSAISGEDEVLFKNEQKFKIKDVKSDKNGQTIYMEEI
ncbi:MAG: hypothetical protein KBA33_08355 [Cloacibacterium sp.]|nr:hypothetical protein [Cloacibacterium sp.]